jgi:predicted permease
VLLIGAGLLARSMAKLLDNNLGFAHDGRATVQLFIWDNVPTAQQRIVRVAELIDRFEALPGVRRAAAVSSLPFHPHAITARSTVVVEGAPVAPGEEPNILATVATSGYFEVMQIPLVSGRYFDDSDRPGTTPVVVINEAFARRHFRGSDPLGRRVKLGVMAAPVLREIIGVVGDVRPSAFDSEPEPEFFIPHAQSGTGSMTFVVHTAGDPDALRGQLRDVVWSIDPAQSIYHSATVADLVGATLAQRRFHLSLAALFAALALALVVLGMYGVISLWARQRNHEFGVRMALGARTDDITRLVLAQGFRFALPGVAAGLLIALLLTRGIEHMLYGVQPTDARTLVQVSVLLLVVVAAAAYVPARAAAARDPLRSIRQ